jgi:ubiquinol-cytochrome c reductase iron-sulfur subunit
MTEHVEAGGPARRDFLYIATGAVGAVAGGAAVWPLVDALNPTADVLALASIDVDLSQIPLGARVTVKWRGSPVFIDHRPEARIARARAEDLDELKDPEPDAARVERPEWLIVVGICTHLGCIPLGQEPGDALGEWGGWFCPCHGSHYDVSGRIRKGPAPLNLVVPPYSFTDDATVRIG